MLILISPAKSLDYDRLAPTAKATEPEFMDQSQLLVQRLRDLSPPDLAALMGISAKLADLNFGRYLNWQPQASRENASQALFAFTGDVYQGLDARTLDPVQIDYAQDHLRILSGLYGVLRPLDLMQPYRLEMGTCMDTGRGDSLYAFWGDRITENLNHQMQVLDTDTLLNLASNEYFGSVRPEKIDGRIISPLFKDSKNGQYKVISFFAKKARGYMARWVIQNRVESPAQLRDFSEQGYRYSAADSTDDAPVFLRDSG